MNVPSCMSPSTSNSNRSAAAVCAAKNRVVTVNKSVNSFFYKNDGAGNARTITIPRMTAPVSLFSAVFFAEQMVNCFHRASGIQIVRKRSTGAGKLERSKDLQMPRSLKILRMSQPQRWLLHISRLIAENCDLS